MKIKLTADSTCDLSAELIQRYNVEIVPLCVVKGDDALRDSIDIQPDDIFRYVAEGNDIPRTSAINTEEYLSIFQKFLGEYDAVIHINISAEFSSCHQNARLAAEGLPVYVIDSRNLSTGSGLVVMAAGDLIAEGSHTAETIVEKVGAMIDKVESSFVIDKLDYLHKGGRCSTVATLGANVLRLRPCIEVQDGKMSVGKKYRASFDRCLRQYVTERLQNRTDISPERIFITHTGCNSVLVDEVKSLVAEFGDFKEVIETRAGCTVSCHCGPGTLGILFVRK